MAEIDAITQGVLDKIDGVGFKQEGAYNLRYNGYPLRQKPASVSM